MTYAFPSRSARHTYAEQCLACGIDPELVADTMGYGSVRNMNNSINNFKTKTGVAVALNIFNHRVSMLRAAHVVRIKNAGGSPREAAERCGYNRLNTMNAAVRKYKQEMRGYAPLCAREG